jgi:hypothetical protein
VARRQRGLKSADPAGAPGDGYAEAPATTGKFVTTVPFDLCIDIPRLAARRDA